MGARDRFGSRVRETATIRRTGTNRVGSLAGRVKGGCSAIRLRPDVSITQLHWSAGPEAAAPLFAHPVGGDNSGANGMEREVIADPGEMGGVLDQRGLGPTLPPRALLTVESSQPRRERRLQPGHPLHEVRFRCCEGEPAYVYLLC